MSKLAIEICLVFVDLWTQTTPNLRDQKWTVRPCLFNALDATWNKLHLKRFLSKFNRNRLRLVWKSKVKCERDFLQFHRCKHAVMHLLNCVSHMQSEIEQRPFWFRRKFEKRALLFYRVFRNLSFGNLPGFLWREAIRIPAFLFSKRALASSSWFSAVLP